MNRILIIDDEELLREPAGWRAIINRRVRSVAGSDIKLFLKLSRPILMLCQM